jgi:hypothetical protein
MRHSVAYWSAMAMGLLILAVVGCNKEIASNDKGVEAAAETAGEADAFASLSAEDRRAAEAQRFCAVEQENPLGSMGPPFKVMIEGQPVFLCCEGCKDAALKDPKATLAAVDKLKQSTSSAP